MIQLTDKQNVLGSKRFIKGLVEYKAPNEILEKSISTLSTSNLNINVSGENELKNANTDGSKNTAFGRVNIQATTKIDADLTYEFGILFALDIPNPVVKLYRGPKVNVCMNLCIFNADDIVAIDMRDGFDTKHVTAFVKEQATKISEMQKRITILKKAKFNQDKVEQIVGRVLMDINKSGRKAGIAQYPFDYGIQLLTDDKSKYFYKQSGFNQWLLYNAFTEYYHVKKVPLFDIPERSLSTHSIIEQLTQFAN